MKHANGSRRRAHRRRPARDVTGSLLLAAAVAACVACAGVPVDSLAAGTTVAPLGRFGGYTLVRHAKGSLGWIGRQEG